MAFSASLPRPGIKMNSTGASFGGCSLCSQGLLLRHHSGSLQICEFTGVASCRQWPVDLAADVVLIAVEVVHGITVHISEVLLDVGLAVDLGHALDLLVDGLVVPAPAALGVTHGPGSPSSAADIRGGALLSLGQQQQLIFSNSLHCYYAATSSSNNSPRPEQSTATTDFEGGRELLASGRADVNYAGVVWLKARQVAEATLRDGAAAELRAAHEEIRADVSPLFLTAGNGDAALVRALLVSALPPLVLLEIRSVPSRGCRRATEEQLDDVHEATLAGHRRPSSRERGRGEE
uniref:Uncharacterized protein n=1 Tax=Oryza rufipogon TaxID=4529 RepID=A0A0E0RB84_ORYRU